MPLLNEGVLAIKWENSFIFTKESTSCKEDCAYYTRVYGLWLDAQLINKNLRDLNVNCYPK